MCWNFAYADGEAEEAIRNETGTFSTRCSICKKTLLDGKLLSHWKSKECIKIITKQLEKDIKNQLKKYR